MAFVTSFHFSSIHRYPDTCKVRPFRLGTNRFLSSSTSSRTTISAAIDPAPLNKRQADKGFYPFPGFGWQKSPPKTGLSSVNKKTATQPILNIIEFVHWIPFVTLAFITYIICANLPTYLHIFGNDPRRIVALLASPVIQTFGGVPAVMMHVYEGWQVVQFEQPLDNRVEIPAFNNEWLREVAYKFLFTFQSLGLVAFNIAAFGFNTSVIGFGVFTLLAAFLGPSAFKATFKWIDGQPVFPVQWSIAGPFIVNAAVNAFAFYTIFGMKGLIAPFVLLLGGLFEGIVAEATFNQWHHFIAFVMVNAGFILEFFLLKSLL